MRSPSSCSCQAERVAAQKQNSKSKSDATDDRASASPDTHARARTKTKTKKGVVDDGDADADADAGVEEVAMRAAANLQATDIPDTTGSGGGETKIGIYRRIRNLAEDFIPPTLKDRPTCAMPARNEPHDADSTESQDWCYVEARDAEPDGLSEKKFSANVADHTDACARLEANSDYISFCGVSVWFLADLQRRIEEGDEASGVRLLVCQENLTPTVCKGDTIKYIRHYQDDTFLGEATHNHERVYFSMNKVRDKPRRDWTLDDIRQQVVLSYCRESGQPFLDLLNNSELGEPFRGAYVCQTRSSSFVDIVESLVAYCRGHDRTLTEQFVWLDIFCVNQTRLRNQDSDGSSSSMCERFGIERDLHCNDALHKAIRRFDDRLIYLNSWRSPAALTRAWCVWEMYGIISSGAKMHVLFAPGEQENFLATLMNNLEEIPLYKVDVRNARCRNKHDLVRIQSAMAALEGGIERVNTELTQYLQKLLLAWTQRAVDAKRRKARGLLPYPIHTSSEQTAGHEPHHHAPEKRHEHFEPWIVFDFSTSTDQNVRDDCLINLATLLSQSACFLHDPVPHVALEYYEEALMIYASLSTPDHGQCAAMHNKIAIVMSTQGRNDEAIERLHKALDLHQALAQRGEHRPLEEATTLQSLAKLKGRIHCHEEAASLYRKVYEIRVKELGQTGAQVASLLEMTAMTHVECQNYEEALQACEEALRIKEKTFGDMSEHVAATQNLIARVYASCGEYERALEHFETSLRIIHETHGITSTRFAWILVRMAPVLRRCGRTQEACCHLENALWIQQNSLGDSHQETAGTHNELAHTFLDLGKLSQAQHHANLSLTYRRAKYGNNEPQVADSLEICALVHEDLGEVTQALSLAEEGLYIRRHCLGVEHEATQKSFFLVNRLTNLTCEGLTARNQSAAAPSRGLSALRWRLTPR